VFVINLAFRFGKHWALFDVDDLEFVDDGEADMRTETHDRSPLLEDCDYDYTLLIN